VRLRADDKKYACSWPVGFGSQVLETTEGILGLSPSRSHRRGDVKSFDSRVNALIDRPKKSADRGERIGRFRRPTRACSRVTVRMSEIDTVR
jgi:hypothetical protein